MNPLSRHYDRTVDVLRLAPASSGTDHEDYQTHLSSVACLIQPLEESFSQDLEQGFGKDSLMFCDDADILEGDRIRTRNGTTYKVVGAKRWRFLGHGQHVELRIRQFI